MMELNPFDEAAIQFCNRHCDKVKILVLERDGRTLWYKRLERERFKWPDTVGEAVMTLSGQQ